MRIIMLLNLMLIMANSCNHGSGVQKETQQHIISHKQFIKDISFQGIVIDKIYCNECNFNKYQIKIKSDDIITDQIELSNLSFPPYYWILTKGEIILSVNKELYDAIQKKSKITKIKNSDSISIKNREFELLSQEKYQWIPIIKEIEKK